MAVTQHAHGWNLTNSISTKFHFNHNFIGFLFRIFDIQSDGASSQLFIPFMWLDKIENGANSQIKCEVRWSCSSRRKWFIHLRVCALSIQNIIWCFIRVAYFTDPWKQMATKSRASDCKSVEFTRAIESTRSKISKGIKSNSRIRSSQRQSSQFRSQRCMSIENSSRQSSIQIELSAKCYQEISFRAICPPASKWRRHSELSRMQAGLQQHRTFAITQSYPSLIRLCLLSNGKSQNICHWNRFVWSSAKSACKNISVQMQRLHPIIPVHGPTEAAHGINSSKYPNLKAFEHPKSVIQICFEDQHQLWSHKTGVFFPIAWNSILHWFYRLLVDIRQNAYTKKVIWLHSNQNPFWVCSSKFQFITLCVSIFPWFNRWYFEVIKQNSVSNHIYSSFN